MGLEEKEGLLDKQITLLKTTTEDLAKAKGALVTSKDFLRMKEDKLVKLEKSFEEVSAANVENVDRIKALENDNRKFQNENVQMSDELQISQKELTQKTAALTEKEEEIVKLKTLVDADESELKETTGAYIELESLMTEEDNTLLEAENEIRKLLEIIAENQEIILKKDKNIIMLQNVIKEKEEYVKNELGGLTKAEMEKQFNDAIRDKNAEIETMKNEMKAALEDLDSKTHKIEKEIDRNRDIILLKDAETDELNAKLNEQTKHVATHDALKVKCEELMKIIMKQNTDMEKLKNDVAIQDAIVNRNETLQKEVLIAKVSTQQKEVDLQLLVVLQIHLLLLSGHLGNENLLLQRLIPVDNSILDGNIILEFLHVCVLPHDDLHQLLTLHLESIMSGNMFGLFIQLSIELINLCILQQDAH